MADFQSAVEQLAIPRKWSPGATMAHRSMQVIGESNAGGVAELSGVAPVPDGGEGASGESPAHSANN